MLNSEVTFYSNYDAPNEYGRPQWIRRICKIVSQYFDIPVVEDAKWVKSFDIYRREIFIRINNSILYYDFSSCPIRRKTLQDNIKVTLYHSHKESPFIYPSIWESDYTDVPWNEKINGLYFRGRLNRGNRQKILSFLSDRVNQDKLYDDYLKDMAYHKECFSPKGYTEWGSRDMEILDLGNLMVRQAFTENFGLVPGLHYCALYGDVESWSSQLNNILHMSDSQKHEIAMNGKSFHTKNLSDNAFCKRLEPYIQELCKFA